jgi:hypothetical protein
VHIYNTIIRHRKLIHLLFLNDPPLQKERSPLGMPPPPPPPLLLLLPPPPPPLAPF